MTIGVKRLRTAELRLWFEDRDPVNDPPDETVGVMQGSLEETQRFASAVLAVHSHGECGCQALADRTCTCPAALSGHAHAVTCPQGQHDDDPLWERRTCQDCGGEFARGHLHVCPVRDA